MCVCVRVCVCVCVLFTDREWTRKKNVIYLSYEILHLGYRGQLRRDFLVCELEKKNETLLVL